MKRPISIALITIGLLGATGIAGGAPEDRYSRNSKNYWDYGYAEDYGGDHGRTPGTVYRDVYENEPAYRGNLPQRPEGEAAEYRYGPAASPGREPGYRSDPPLGGRASTASGADSQYYRDDPNYNRETARPAYQPDRGAYRDTTPRQPAPRQTASVARASVPAQGQGKCISGFASAGDGRGNFSCESQQVPRCPGNLAYQPIVPHEGSNRPFEYRCFRPE